MERLMREDFPGQRRSSHLAAQAMWKLGRMAKQFSWRFGAWGWINLGLLLALLLSAALLSVQRQTLVGLGRRLSTVVATASGNATASTSAIQEHKATTRDRLNDFDARLLEQVSVAQAVQDLLRSAEDQGLLIERGDYETQADPQGGFMRFRMNLPVKGPAAAIHRFIKSALLEQPMLALEGIRFKREGLQTGSIEAQLSWVLLTRSAVAPVKPVPRLPSKTVGQEAGT